MPSAAHTTSTNTLVASPPCCSIGVTYPAEIDLEAIAWTMGAKVRYRPLDGCEARIIGRDDQAIITINERSPPRRQRFSLAHEIGIGHTTEDAASFAAPTKSTGAARIARRWKRPPIAMRQIS